MASNKKRARGVKARPIVPLQLPLRPLPEIGFVRLPAVLAHVGLGKSTVWALVKQRKFPAPVRITEGTVGWSAADVRAWIAGRIAASAEHTAA